MAPPSRPSFVELPLETQKQVFRYLGRKDLLNTLTVSSRILALACAELYRKLDLKLTNSESDDDGTSSVRTAEALQTIIASDYNYGQHIKSFRLSPPDDSSQTAAVMSRFLWDTSAPASKVLNTSLLLMIKRASMLESFLWDIPIELSGSVYQALHKIQGLRHLRLRLDVTLPLRISIHPGSLPSSQQVAAHPPTASLSTSFPSSLASASSSSFGISSGAKSRIMKKKKAGGRNFWSGNRELSGFKHLNSLSLLGISSLDYLGEIRSCLSSSSATLKSLSLSLSTDLALKARKASAVPPPPVDDVTTDEEDDDMVDPPPATTPVATPATTEADVRKEKQAQDAILAKLFNMEDAYSDGKRLEKNLVLANEVKNFRGAQHFTSMVHDIKDLTQRLIDAGNGGSDAEAIEKEAMELVYKHTVDYMKKTCSKPKKEIGSKSPAGGSSKPLAEDQLSASQPPSNIPELVSVTPMDWSSGSLLDGSNQLESFDFEPFLSETPPSKFDPSAYFPQPSGTPGTHYSSWGDGPFSHNFQPSSTSASTSYPGTSSSFAVPIPTDLAKKMQINAKGSKSKKTASSKSKQSNVPVVNPGEKGTSLPSKDPTPLEAALLANEIPEYPVDVDMIHPDEDPTEIVDDQETLSEQEEEQEADTSSPRKRVRFGSSDALKSEVDGLPETLVNGGGTKNDVPEEEPIPKEESSPEEAMQEYIRINHGYHLEEIKLCWIPITGSILARALDLSVLKRITLLNAGPQDRFWTVLSAVQARHGGIALKCIHTDNVSKSFLNFLKSSEGLKELFMHERSSKNDVDTAPHQAKVGIKEIRQLALRKHLRTLNKLMIKNENDSNWDLDAITITLLSERGTGLTELAISLNSKHFHTLMQNLAALKNLQALHVLAIRGSSSPSISNIEYLNTVVDNISHYLSHSKMKYLAVDNFLSQIQRRSTGTARQLKQAKMRRQKAKTAKEKGKGKSNGTDALSDTSSETDFPDEKELHELYAMKARACFLQDYKDVEHVKIFQSELRAGAF